jgi:hypothetical protein
MTDPRPDAIRALTDRLRATTTRLRASLDQAQSAWRDYQHALADARERDAFFTHPDLIDLDLRDVGRPE